MPRILIGGDASGVERIQQWLDGWGLRAEPLGREEHPAAVARERARAVLFACGTSATSGTLRTVSAQAAPLILVGTAPAGHLDSLAWDRVADPGPQGENLALVLRPCLDATVTLGCDGPSFRDFLNHELRTPLTAAGMALQTLALHLEQAGGPSLDLVDTALRNIRRLEQTVEWATDYVADEPDADAGDPIRLTELLEDLDDLEPGLSLSWATGVGDWQARATIGRHRWRRLLRQIMRAVAYRQVDAPVHLDVSVVGEASGLLMVFQLPAGRSRGDLAEGEEEQLRRLLGFTVHPDLARRLQLRYDVVRTTEFLRLRILLPLSDAWMPSAVPACEAELQPA
ncbi:MAG: hypothetical protein R3D98_07160 [Candidatus Krumholzibacteriia bacterium]